MFIYKTMCRHFAAAPSAKASEKLKKATHDDDLFMAVGSHAPFILGAPIWASTWFISLGFL